MSTSVDAVLYLAEKWKGQRDLIVDVYNSFQPLARGYRVKYQDSLCATYISALFIRLGATSIVPPECGAMQLARNMDALGRYHEKDKCDPAPGDIIFFDWQGDSWIDHVGIVTEVKNNIVVYSHIPSYSVKVNEILKSSQHIRGYARPEYDTDDTPAPEVPSGEITVGDLVAVKNGASWYNGYNIPRYVFDLTWEVIAVRGDRVVLGADTTGRYNIQSPIHASDLSKVKTNASGDNGDNGDEDKLSSSTITDMAKAVIRGEFGNGLTRRIRLGQYYDQVQAEVNRLLGK